MALHTSKHGRVIEIEERFEVPARPATVWALLADPDAVVGCVPGAAIVGHGDDGSLETTLSVRFGPIAVGFQARAELELDHAALRGTLTARGKDKQGGARFQGTSAFAVGADGRDGAVVTVTGTIEISGRLASMIEGGANVVAKRMAAEFAACLRARVSG